MSCPRDPGRARHRGVAITPAGSSFAARAWMRPARGARDAWTVPCVLARPSYPGAVPEPIRIPRDRIGYDPSRPGAPLLVVPSGTRVVVETEDSRWGRVRTPEA